LHQTKFNTIFTYRIFRRIASNSKRYKRTKRHVRLSVVSIRGVHPIGEANRGAMLRRNLEGGEIRDKPTEYTKYHELIIRQIVKLIAIRCRT